MRTTASKNNNVNVRTLHKTLVASNMIITIDVYKLCMYVNNLQFSHEWFDCFFNKLLVLLLLLFMTIL